LAIVGVARILVLARPGLVDVRQGEKDLAIQFPCDFL